jgi:hypothetical protein
MAAALSFVFFLVILTGVNGLNGGVRRSSAVAAVGIALIIVAGLGIVWCLVIFAQMGVSVSEKGILIQNWFRHISIQWGDIERFGFGNAVEGLSAREHLSSPVLQTYVIKKGGEHFVMSGLTATRINRSESKRRVQEILDQLETERLHHASDWPLL